MTGLRLETDTASPAPSSRSESTASLPVAPGTSAQAPPVSASATGCRSTVTDSIVSEPSMAVGSAAADPSVICSRRHPSRQNGVRSETTDRPSPTGPRKTVRGRSVGGTSRSRTTNGSSVVSRLSRSRPTRLPVTTGTGPVASRPATSDAEVPGVHCSFHRPTRARRVVSRTEKTGPG